MDPNFTKAIADDNVDDFKSTFTQFSDSLLSQAITNNSIQIISYLVNQGASVYSKMAQTALQAPESFPALIAMIKEGHLDVNTNFDHRGTLLIQRARRGNEYQVRELLACGANPNLGLRVHLYTPLASAVEYDASPVMLKMLLDAGATMQGSDALHVAALNGRVDALRLLLDNGADVNEIGFEYAALESFAEKAGAPLHYAVDGGHEEVVRFLLEKGADRQVKDVQERIALERAREAGAEGGIIALLEG